MQDLVQNRFRKRPCYFQIKVAQALYAEKDVVACAPIGAGKTLTFWIPILMALEEGKDKMSIVVTPLNLLGVEISRCIFIVCDVYIYTQESS